VGASSGDWGGYPTGAGRQASELKETTCDTALESPRAGLFGNVGTFQASKPPTFPNSETENAADPGQRENATFGCSLRLNTLLDR
jgi:hypothetical protein